MLISKKYNLILPDKSIEKNYAKILKSQLQKVNDTKIYELLASFLCPEITEGMYQMMKESLSYSLSGCQKGVINKVRNDVMAMPKNLNIKMSIP